MKWELIAVALFWLLYGPISVVIWGNNFSSLVVILTIGIVFTAIFLGSRLLMQHIKAKNYNVLIEEKMDILDQLENEETEPEADSEETETVLEEKASAPQIQEPLD